MRKRTLLPVAVPALVLVVAAPAYAAVGYSYFEPGLSYSANGDGAADNITITCAGDAVMPATVPVAPCSTLTRFFISPGAGADSVDLSGITAADFPDLTEIRVIDEDDFDADDFTGSELGDTFVVGGADDVDAGAGDDVIEGGSRVDGGPGHDVLFQAGSSEGAFGGPGDDRFVQTLSSGGNDGGSGYDVMEVDLDRASGIIDGLRLTLTAAQLLVAAGDLEQSVFIAGFEEFHVRMARGEDQSFDAVAFPGRVVYYGARSADTFVGSDFEDVISTGAGDDTVMARDGAFDLVDCGAGDDTAVVDATDRVVNCEDVSYPRPATSRISGPKKITKGSSASYTFGSSIDGSVFGCRIDKGSWTPCASPYTVKAKGKLKKGKHTLLVRAGYPAGNWDATPAKKKIKIKK
ncbi:hypothetical protein [Nocardioides sp.]|uniref:hypothetical protein n=1 Tax=Nocardioides sp. TaxID=35761 RepID=UPI002630F85B|nr:hypothetical protein [Nocardioides sp.]